MVARTQPGRLRAIAAFTALALVVCGLLARRHEASVAHVRDLRTGEAIHALATGCHEQAPAEHLHSLPSRSHHDAGPCNLLGTLHQAVRLAHPIAITAIPRAVERMFELSPATTASSTRLLLSAPKTSPPSIG